MPSKPNNWVKVDQGLLKHRKTYDFATELGLDEVNAVGHLIALWTWMVEHHPDGILAVSEKVIARECMWNGWQTPEDFVRALVNAGFLEYDENSNLRIHNWEKWFGKRIRQRELGTKRTQKSRKKSKEM